MKNVKWNWPYCPWHPALKLETMKIIWHRSHVEMCPQGCLWGYITTENRWVSLKLIEKRVSRSKPK